MVHYKLYYFPFAGRSDFLRYILEYAQVPYENVVIPFENWASEKQKMPMSVLPVLELEDGRQLSQSLAIARYLGKRHGLMNEDDFENAWGDQLACALEDIYPRYARPLVAATFFEKDETKRKEAWETMKINAVIPLFAKLEQFLGEKTWFCGDKMHWSDLVIAETVDRIERTLENGFTDSKFPHVYAHCQRVHQIPQIKKYADKRPPYLL